MVIENVVTPDDLGKEFDVGAIEADKIRLMTGDALACQPDGSIEVVLDPASTGASITANGLLINGSGGDLTPVISPGAGAAIDVGGVVPVSVAFPETMDAATAGMLQVIDTSTGLPVAGTWTTSDNALFEFDNTQLDANGSYEIVVPANVKNSSGQDGTQGQIVSNFTTNALDLTATITPMNGATQIDRDSVITVVFPETMDGGTAALLSVVDASNGGAAVAGSWTTSDNITFTFTPSAQLASLADIQVDVDASVQNQHGSTGTQGAQSATFETLSQNGLDILAKYPASADGEYLIQPDGETPVLTWIDMTTDGGGWVMVWSYSESRAIGSYTPTGFVQMSANYRLRLDVPRNVSDTVVDYMDFRMANSMMKALRSGAFGEYRGRFIETPNGADDALSNDNHFIAKPTATNRDLVEASASFGAYRGADIPTVGRINGNDFTVGVAADGVTPLNGSTLNGSNFFGMYWYNNVVPECFDTIGVPGLIVGNDSFGYYVVNDSDHFGATLTTPHAPERYMQWFIR